MPGSSAGDGGELGAGAFRRVYPEEFLRRFLRQGVRPDGRPLARGRPVSIEVGAAQVGAAASCLVRCGGTVALAGVHLGLREPEDDRPRQGRLTVEAALHPLAPPEVRGWKAAQAEGAFTERLRGVLQAPSAVDLEQLGVVEGVAAWALHVKVYVLSADGAVFDAALLAAVAALASTTVPTVEAAEGASLEELQREAGAGEGAGGRFCFQRLPLSMTLCTCTGGHLLADPTLEEETHSDGFIHAVVDERGELLSLDKAGGGADMDGSTLNSCVQAAIKRLGEVLPLLAEALGYDPTTSPS